MNDNDLIRRSDLLEELRIYYNDEALDDIEKEYNRALYDIEKMIHVLPSVDKDNNIPMSVLDDIKAEFINRYPKNYMNELELGGRSCVFSLMKVLEIIDSHISGKGKE